MILEIKTTGFSKHKPTKVKFAFTFKKENKNYEEVISNGAKSISKFMDGMKNNFNLSNDSFKTTSYKVKEINKYIKNEDKFANNIRTTTEYIFDHYEFTQDLNITIDYDSKLLFETISYISTIQDAPFYRFYFDLDENTRKSLEDNSLFKAVDLANDKAQKLFTHINQTGSFSIITTLESKIVESFDTNEFMNYYRGNDRAMVMKCSSNMIEELSKSITPEDIEVSINVITTFEFN